METRVSYRVWTLLVCAPLMTVATAVRSQTLPEQLTKDVVETFLTDHGISTVEGLIEALPPLHKRHFVAVFDSAGLSSEFTSLSHPRIVSWGADARFILAWSTNLEDPLADSVEFLQHAPDDARWIAGVFDFSAEEPAVRHPDSCARCHGTLNRPIWGEDETWRGTEDDRTGAFDWSAFAESMLTSDHPRLAPLDVSDYGVRSRRRITVPAWHGAPGFKASSTRPAWEFGQMLIARHAEVLFEGLKSRDFDQHFGSVVCSPGSPHRFMDRMDDMFPLADYNLNLLADGSTMVQGVGKFDPGYPGDTIWPSWDGGYYGGDTSLKAAIAFLILHDLQKNNRVVRGVYDRTSSHDASRSPYHCCPTNFRAGRVAVDRFSGAAGRVVSVTGH